MMTSRDTLDDSSSASGSEADDLEDASAWKGISQKSEPPAIVFENSGGRGKKRFSLDYQQRVQERSSQQGRGTARMATADNRHSVVPNIPERSTSKRYRSVHLFLTNNS